MQHSKEKRISQRFSLSKTMNSLTSEQNRRTSTSERRSRSDERKESRRISNPNFNLTPKTKRFIHAIFVKLKELISEVQ